MRILHAAAELALGGAEKTVVELARSGQAGGAEVAVAAASGPRERELAEAGLRFIELPATGRSPGRLAAAVLALARVLRSFKPDVLHAHNVRMTLVAAVARRLASPTSPPALVATFQAVDQTELRSAARLLRLADGVACVSEQLREQLHEAGFPAGRAVVVPNVVALPEAPDAERLRRLDAELGLDGAPVVSNIGRLVPQKAQRRFLDAAAIVARHHGDVRFLVVGKGPLRAELEQHRDALGLGDRLLFTGLREDVPDLIARSRLVVFSSEWEGLSLVALESLAAGVPVVSTDVAGMRSLLAEGAGLIVEERTPEALADGIDALLADEARHSEMGQHARRLIAERFSPAVMADGYNELYERLGCGRPYAV